MATSRCTVLRGALVSLALACSLVSSAALAQAFPEEPATEDQAIPEPVQKPDEVIVGDPIPPPPPTGLLGPWRFGPQVSVSVPHPLTYGIDVIYEDWISFAFTTGKIEREVDRVNVQLAHWDVRARWHPFRGSFFVGGSYGKQEFRAKAAFDAPLNASGLNLTIPSHVQFLTSNSYLTPHIGWLWIWDSGFNMGFELGAQIPIGSRVETKTAFENVTASQIETLKNTKEYKDNEKLTDDYAKLISKTVLPHLTLLRLGWFF